MTGPSLQRYSSQAIFAAVAAILALAGTLIAASGYWCYLQLADQTARYTKYNALQRDAGKADSLSAAYEKALNEIETIRKAMPPQNQGSYALNVLTEGARNFNLGLSGVNALDEIPFSGYTELPFELGLSGDFPNFLRYLHSLEIQGMVLSVRRLAIKNESMNKARVQARLELSVFVPGAGHARPAPGDTSVTSLPETAE
jgi:hypothetical protein